MVSSKIKSQAIYLASFVVIMIGISYASVPLYKIFCQVTGYGGTPKVSEENNTKLVDSNIEVRLDSSIEKNSPLYFANLLVRKEYEHIYKFRF